jgi:hypothetical protein
LLEKKIEFDHPDEKQEKLSSIKILPVFQYAWFELNGFFDKDFFSWKFD